MAADPEKKSEFVDSAHMHMMRHYSKNMVNSIPRVKDDLSLPKIVNLLSKNVRLCHYKLSRIVDVEN